jgi:hypothetical protein
MGSVVEFPNAHAFDLNKAPLTTADELYVVGLDGNMIPVKSGESQSWWGVTGLWLGTSEEDTLNIRLSACFLDYDHAVGFAEDITSADNTRVIICMPDELVDEIQNAMLIDVLTDLEVTDD